MTEKRGEEGKGRGHSIGAVTRRTGVTAATLRAWERRYGAVRPRRTEGGHRLYSDEDVERLRLLHELTRSGRKIGRIAGLSTDELGRLLREDDTAAATAPGDEELEPRAARAVEGFLPDAYRAVEGLHPERLDRILRRAALALSTETFVDDLMAPLMERVGRAWADGRLGPAHEHVASAVASRVTGWLMDAYRPLEEEGSCLVAATPSGVRHELGALWAGVIGASEGWRVRHLGADLPGSEIALAARGSGADVVAVSLVFPLSDPDVAAELRDLRRNLGEEILLIVGGRAAGSYGEVLEEVGASPLDDFGAFRSVLRRLGRARLARV